MKLFQRRQESRPEVERRIQQIFDEAVVGRTIQLGRGNLFIQRGAFATQTEWKRRREEHAQRLDSIDLWLAAAGHRED